MLTQKDLEEIKQLLDKEFDKRLKFLPTREEFYAKTDEVMGELKTIREQQELITGRVSIHSDQLEDHETRLSKLEQPSSTS